MTSMFLSILITSDSICHVLPEVLPSRWLNGRLFVVHTSLIDSSVDLFLVVKLIHNILKCAMSILWNVLHIPDLVLQRFTVCLGTRSSSLLIYRLSCDLWALIV